MGLTGIDSAVEYVGWQLVDWMRRIRSRNWPATNAKVVFIKQSRKLVGCTSVIIRFRYSVAGEMHHGTHHEPFFIDLPGSFLRQYPVGREIMVRYNPTNPSRSVAMI